MSKSGRILMFGVALALSAAMGAGAAFAAPQEHHAKAKAAASAGPAAKADAAKAELAKANEADAVKEAAAEYRRDCILGIEGLQMRLIRQYPDFSKAFVKSYPDLAANAGVACVNYTVYLVSKSGKKANTANISANISARLSLQDNVPDTLKSLETFRELMVDSE